MLIVDVGFIGFHLTRRLLELGAKVCGFDSVNDYYDVQLKEDRLRILSQFNDFSFVRANLADAQAVNRCFEEFDPDIVVNLAAQAGVRYSIDNPYAYVELF